MKIWHVVILLSLVCLQPLKGKPAEINYPVSEIPDSLKEGMYAVIRENEQKFIIEGKGSSSYFHRIVVTILKPEGKSLAEFHVFYDKLRSPSGLKASVYDAEGKLIKRLKSNEIEDESATSGDALIDDSRMKHANLAQSSYPYTVEYEYSLNMNFLYDAPDFRLIRDDEVSIQKSSYSVVYPPGMKPRYKLINIQQPQISTLGSKQEMMMWSFANIKPRKFEQFLPDNSLPAILVSPNEFVFSGYAGSLSTWQSQGQWQAVLNKDRDILPEATLQKVKSLTSSAKSTEEKVKILYEYMQSRTRYVGIQLGIGGLQPFEAKVVDQTGYGDCKGLSNYMIALLKAAGVKGYYTTIMAGRNETNVIEDFPSDQSNHVIVAVPNVTDTLWLECTSQTNPFGYMGRFTCDRKALMVTETGGRLVSTPRYDAVHNLQVTTGKVNLLATGDATAKVKTVSTGLQYDDVLVDAPNDQQKKWLQNQTDIPSFDITSFRIQNNKSRKPSAIVEMDLALKRYASISGKRLFVAPNLMNKSKFVPEKNDNRKSKVFIRSAYTDVDTIIFSLPDAMFPEFMPPTTKLKTPFGEYEASFTVLNNSFVYVRRLRMNKGEFSKESYSELVKFYKEIAKADNTKMVFLNKT